MANIIVIEDDPRIEGQIKSFVKELGEDNEVHFFATSEAFEKIYCYESDPSKALIPPPSPENATSPAKAPEEDLFLKLSSVDLLIFKSQCLKEEARAWVTKTLKALKANKFSTLEKTTRFIGLKYEDDGVDKDYFIHPLIEDIIYLPLDRLVFLQTVEIVLNLPRRGTPSFLFSQPVEQNIEISKKTLIEKISDLGFAIRNPFRLAPGTINHFYLRLPGQNETLDLYAKSIYSEAHPELKNQFLVYYSFLGVTAKQNQSLRKFLTSQPDYKDLIEESSPNFKYRPPPDAPPSKGIEKTIAILDNDPNQADLIEDILHTEIDQVKVVRETSFYYFTTNYIEKENIAAVPGEANELYAPTISWTIRTGNMSVIEVNTKPASNSLLVGYNAANLFSRPTGWHSLFGNADSKAMLEEALNLIKSGQRYSQNTILQDANGTLKYFYMIVTLGKDKASAKIELKVPEIMSKKSADKKLSALDLVIVNQALLPENVDGWMSRLKEIAVKNGVVGENQQIPIIVISDEKNGWPPKKIRYQKIFGLLYKPFKNRPICNAVSSAINSPFTKYSLTNIGWTKVIIPVFVAIESQLENLAEFGATISATKPFAPGTCLYLHESIFADSPEGHMAARFYFAEENQKKKGQFSCYLLYFGITDTFLKYIRTWIRKDFTDKKKGKG